MWSWSWSATLKHCFAALPLSFLDPPFFHPVVERAGDSGASALQKPWPITFGPRLRVPLHTEDPGFLVQSHPLVPGVSASESEYLKLQFRRTQGAPPALSGAPKARTVHSTLNVMWPLVLSQCKEQEKFIDIYEIHVATNL